MVLIVFYRKHNNFPIINLFYKTIITNKNYQE